MQEYAGDNEAFYRDWYSQFQEMSLLGETAPPQLALRWKMMAHFDLFIQ